MDMSCGRRAVGAETREWGHRSSISQPFNWRSRVEEIASPRTSATIGTVQSGSVKAQRHVIGVVKGAVDPVVYVVRSDAGAGVEHDVVVIGFSLVQQFGKMDLSTAAVFGVGDAGLR
jgi:hypothetical protein